MHEIFESNVFHHLPVLSHGKLSGIISRTDYTKVRHALVYSWDGCVAMNASFAGLKAEDIMVADVLHIEPTDTVGLAADIFLSNTIHALPVLEDSRLVGIITSHDVLKYAYEPVVSMEA